MDKEVVRRNFSKSARHYDRYSYIQDLCASRLISKIEGDGFGKILDIGCGTGNYTRLLRERYPQASIKAVEISRQMVDVAREKLSGCRVDFFVRDAEAMRFDDKFDLISSNASFQWFENLKDALSKYSALLKDGGIIAFSAFGPETFCELDRSLKRLFGSEVSISAYGFIGKDRIEVMLKEYFRTVEIGEEIYKKSYNSLRELLTNIKYTGARGRGLKNGTFWTPKVVGELGRCYKEVFGGIKATYQVYYCRGVK